MPPGRWPRVLVIVTVTKGIAIAASKTQTRQRLVGLARPVHNSGSPPRSPTRESSRRSPCCSATWTKDVASATSFVREGGMPQSDECARSDRLLSVRESRRRSTGDL